MISIIILTYNRKTELIRCLKSVYSQPYSDFEVIIINNGSTDGTSSAVNENNFPRLKLIDNINDTNFARARNLGIKESSGDIIAFLDDDCVPEKDWLKRIAESLLIYDAVGGICVPYTELDFPAWWHPEMGWMVGLSVPGHYDDRAGRICYPQTANLAIRKDVFLKENFQDIDGKFQDGSFVYFTGREDAEFWRRLRVNGYKTFFDSALKVYHDIPQSRIDFKYVRKRAFTDGVTLCRRENKPGYQFVAANDIVLFPLRALRTLFGNANNKYAELHSCYLWAIRQAGYLTGFLEKKSLPSKIISLFQLLGKSFFEKTSGRLKRIARKIVAGFYQISRSHKKRFFKNNMKSKDFIKNIIVFSPAFLGDMVVIMPGLSMIKKAYPDSHVSLVCFRNGKTLLDNEKIVDEIITIDKYYGKNKELWLSESSKKLNNKVYDVGIVLYFSDALPELVFRSKINYIIGYDKDIGFSKEIWYDLFDEKLNKNLQINEVQNLINLVGLLDIHNKPQKYKLHLSAEEKAAAEKFLERYCLTDKKVIAVHIGTMREVKKWTSDRWGELIRMLEESGEYTVVFTSGLDEKENADKIIEKYKLKAKNLCGKANPRELCAIFKHYKALITLCSGPKHLAYLADLPTITLYAAEVEKWGPYWNDGRHRAVHGNNFDLTFEESLGLPVNHLMSMITPKMVYDETMDVVKQNYTIEE